jgi:hypothetical protein
MLDVELFRQSQFVPHINHGLSRIYQERQCRFNVALGRVRANIVAVEKQWVLHIPKAWVCSRRYLVWNLHATYFRLCPLRPCYIFPHYLMNYAIYHKPSLNIKCVFWFSLQLLTETFFFILTRTERDIIENVYWSSCKVPIILVRVR